ncbi:MAG: TonB-dependent receptor [Pseudomonadota bacterium]
MSTQSRNSRSLFRRGVGVTALAVAMSGGAYTAAFAQAPSAEAPSIDMITVTARKQETSLQETPIAITAVTGEELVTRGLSDVTDVGAFTPNVDFSSGTTDIGGAANAAFFIRGIGQLDFAPTSDPGVGLYIDGVYLGRSVGSVLELADLERIEILKGPQGTLFGKNTIGGAINVTTRKPGDELAGSVMVTGGEDGRFNVDADLEGPIANNLSGRVAFGYRSQEGFVVRPNAGDKVGDEGQWVTRAKLLWEPTGATSVLLSGDFTKIDTEGNLGYHPFYAFETAPLASLWNGFVGVPSGVPLSNDVASPDNPRLNFGVGSNDVEYDGWGVSLNIEHDFGAALLRSITSGRGFDARNQREADGSPANFAQLDYSDEQWQISQELNLIGRVNDRIGYTTGVFYFHEEADSTWRVNLAPGLFDALNALPAPLVALTPTSTCPPVSMMDVCVGGAGNPLNVTFDIPQLIEPSVDVTSVAVFGEVEILLTDRLSLIGGLRYTYDEKDYEIINSRQVTQTFIVPTTNVSESWNDVSPRVIINYQATDDNLVYASVSKGFKAGGFNARPANVFFAERPFDPEFVWAYELAWSWRS